MRRPQLQHIIRAAAAITGADEFGVIGSQAVLGQFPGPPDDLTVSIETLMTVTKLHSGMK